METTKLPRYTARALAVLLWIAGSAYLVRNELSMPNPDWVVIATMPLIWAAVIALPILAHHAWKQAEYTACLLLTLAAVVGSCFTLQGTIARQSEARDGKVAEAQASNFKRSELLEELGRAQRRLDDANRYADAERTTTCGPRCKDWERRAVEVKAYIDQTTAAIAALGADKPVASGEKRVAAAIGLLPFVTASQEKVEAAVALFLPSLFGLFLELAALASAFFGWRPTMVNSAKSLKCKTVTDGSDLSLVGSDGTEAGSDRQSFATRGRDLSAVAGDPELAKVSDTELQRLRNWYFLRDQEPTPEPPKTKKRKPSKKAKRREDVIAKIRAQTLAGNRPSFTLVQKRYRLPKSTASRYLKAATA
jgi:hypothetical protein